MTEDEYIDATNLARISDARKALAFVALSEGISGAEQTAVTRLLAKWEKLLAQRMEPGE